MKPVDKIITFLLLLMALQASAQDKTPAAKVSGDMGVWYDGYRLNKTPGSSAPDFYAARRPSDLYRYAFNPSFALGKWTIPFNFIFSPTQNNFTTSVAGGKQSVWQFLTNPVNNFAINPKIGTTEFLLGTQNLQYSDLSTGDLGVFGYGANLAPGIFRIKVFNGVSQRPVEYQAPTIAQPLGVVGAYQRNQWMGQLGIEQEGKYFVGFNFVKSADKVGSVTAPPLLPIEPQDNVVVTFLAKISTPNGWAYHIELGQSFFTRNLNAPPALNPALDFKPLLDARTTTGKDNAVMAGITKKGKDWEIGAKANYYGVGYYTAGYPFMSNDRVEYLANTRFNAWKKKINVTASMGERFGNLSRVAGPDISKQIIANVNVFTQFTDKFSLNTSFNNFGFNSPSLSGYKSVSNEVSINPSYTWSSTKMSNLLSATYTRSKYDETTTSGITNNNTQTALLLYVPTFFTGRVNPDFNLMWFNNDAPLIKLTLWSATGGMTWKTSEKFNIKSQLQYNLSTTSPYTANKNVLATAGFDWQLYKKLSWQFMATANLYRYGTELPGSALLPVYQGYPGYMESTVRTGLHYKF